MSFSFDSFSSFLAMGGHAPYVWSCYGLTFLLIIYNIWQPVQQKRKFIAEQQRRIRREKQNHASQA